MDKEESLALYGKGRDAWNSWANDMLAKKAELEKYEPWQMDDTGHRISEVTKVWERNSRVVFSEHSFEEDADFSGFVFPFAVCFNKVIFKANADFRVAIFSYDVIFRNAVFCVDADFTETKFKRFTDFSKATFRHYAVFYDAIFSGKASFRGSVTFCSDAEFQKATFSGKAMFENAKFRGNVKFEDATFIGEALFYKAEFSGAAIFDDTKFGGATWFNDAIFSNSLNFDRSLFETVASFRNASFKGRSSFIAIEGKSYFSFEDAKFHVAPDFNQAHFTEAPQFDNADFSNAQQSKGNFSSSWRSLKRLAIQGHDHERELMFFAEEIKSQRGIQDKALPHLIDYINTNNKDTLWPGGARYWLGYLYEYSSNFGRSVMLPLFWLLALGFLFYWVYLGYSIDPKPQESISCNQSEAAVYLSVRSALPFLPATSYSENLSRSYACLYGKNSDEKENTPNAIVFISIFQTILSTILIFLLLLALRNHFRIK